MNNDNRLINDVTVSYLRGLRESLNDLNLEAANTQLLSAAEAAKTLNRSVDLIVWNDGKHRVAIDVNPNALLTVSVDGQPVDAIVLNDDQPYTVALSGASVTMREWIASFACGE